MALVSITSQASIKHIASKEGFFIKGRCCITGSYKQNEYKW